MIIFLVQRPKNVIENMIVTADSREMAKQMARGILGGDPELYVITPLTEPGSRTVLMVAAEVVR